MNTNGVESREAGKTVVAVLTALRLGDSDAAEEVIEEAQQPKLVAYALASMLHGMLTKLGEIVGDPGVVDRRIQELALEVEQFGLPQ